MRGIEMVCEQLVGRHLGGRWGRRVSSDVGVNDACLLGWTSGRIVQPELQSGGQVSGPGRIGFPVWRRHPSLRWTRPVRRRVCRGHRHIPTLIGPDQVICHHVALSCFVFSAYPVPRQVIICSQHLCGLNGCRGGGGTIRCIADVGRRRVRHPCHGEQLGSVQWWGRRRRNDQDSDGPRRRALPPQFLVASSRAEHRPDGPACGPRRGSRARPPAEISSPT